ncbi:MAG: hypothetical protein IT260_21585 [Saprospiraceae bacterium]|nr:hypothetical protein [Saprospiraceae bacterium]
MQKILLLLTFVCLALPALNAQNTRRTEVFFTQYHTQTDLMNIKGELKAQKILLEYTHMAFDAQGHLTELSFTVDCQDGFKGSGSSTKIPEDTRFGFVRDRRPGAKSPFTSGEILE